MSIRIITRQGCSDGAEDAGDSPAGIQPGAQREKNETE
jgi:hypothetical protein